MYRMWPVQLGSAGSFHPGVAANAIPLCWPWTDSGRVGQWGTLEQPAHKLENGGDQGLCGALLVIWFLSGCA
jgi:hypothetical protein